MGRKEDFLITAIVFTSLAFLLLIHHRLKHHLDKHPKWFKIDDVFNENYSHEKFVIIFGALAIGFWIAYGVS